MWHMLSPPNITDIIFTENKKNIQCFQLTGLYSEKNLHIL